MRYDEDDFIEALYSAIHEVGHALYEQGLPVERYGSSLGESVSLGLHESQSRMWENMVARSRAFTEFLDPLLREHQIGGVGPDRLYRLLNRVQPSYIRTEADEVTYNLHVILRYEIERALFGGELEIDDLRDAWNEKMREYFDLEVEDDACGILQDVHWSDGSFGYFPTYALGNLYAAQFFRAAERCIPDLQARFRRGDFGTLLYWLRDGIHQHGNLYTADELCLRVTGEPLTASAFTEYLGKKYGELYGI